MSLFLFSPTHAFVAENKLKSCSSGRPAQMDDAVKLCSGNTVNPVTVMFSEGLFLRYCAFCKSLLLFFILLFICQTKIFMVILTILCNFFLLYCILFFLMDIYYRGLIKSDIDLLPGYISISKTVKPLSKHFTNTSEH